MIRFHNVKNYSTKETVKKRLLKIRFEKLIGFTHSVNKVFDV